MPELTWLFLFPIFSSLVLFALPGISLHTLRYLASALASIPLLLLLFFAGEGWVGREAFHSWAPLLEINFHLKVAPLSLPFLYLTAVISPIALLALRFDEVPFPSVLCGWTLLSEGLLIGFFTAQDLVLFLIFWESMLLPLYFMMAMGGKAEQRRAALKFMTYMVAGSALMVAAVLALYFTSVASGIPAPFDLEALSEGVQAISPAPWIGAVFFLAFAVKTPLFPFHAWLPETYVCAPATGTILLSALLSKAGIYGFFRIGWGLFPSLLQHWSPWLLSLAIAGVLYGGMAAWAQGDFKRLLAYSSFSHVNFILAGVFASAQIAHEGALLQAFNHGITMAGLFLVAGWLEERLGSSAMGPYSGLAAWMPQLCWLTFLFVLSSLAVPGTHSFVGELLVLFGLYGPQPWVAGALGLTLILSAMYLLRWMQRVYFEQPSPKQLAWIDIGGREWAAALPLIFLILWIGIYPGPLLKQIIPAVQEPLAALADETEG